MGGAERQALYFAKFLKQRNYNVHVLGMGPAGLVSTECNSLGIPWSSAPSIHHTGFRNVHKLLQFGFLLKRLQPSVLLPYTATPNMVAGLWWKAVGARVSVWNQRDAGLVRPHVVLERYSAQNTPLYIANATSGHAFLRSIGVTKPINLITNGVTPHFASNKTHAREYYNLGEKQVVYGMLANLHKGKDHVTLIKAWAKAKLKNSVLLVAGRNDGQLPILQALVQELNVQDSVQFLGGIVDTQVWLSTLDVLIHSSFSEGCPNAVLEAMAAKLPVIGTDIPEITSLLTTPAYSFRPGDSTKLAELLEKFKNNPPLRKTIGANNLKLANSYSIECMCNKTLNVIAPFIK